MEISIDSFHLCKNVFFSGTARHVTGFPTLPYDPAKKRGDLPARDIYACVAIFRSFVMLSERPVICAYVQVIVRLSASNVLTTEAKDYINSSNVGLIWTSTVFGLR